ncbi:MAG TPA: hypothetical protein VK669_13195 [Candidatus Limnocylindrales bacterium]|nr:hypothetical protein [Candidatus Limnocylindrales bacterium]
MTTTQAWVRIAGALAGLTVVAIALINGMTRWDAASVVSLWLLAIAVAYVFWAPTLARASANGDAVRMGLAGPLFVQAAILLGLSAFALLIARGDGSRTTVWIIDVLYVAVLLVGAALLMASAPIIEAAATPRRPAEPAAPRDENW